MTLQSSIRKIYFGVADRRQMFRLFDRHAQRPDRWQNDDSALFAGEWFEIARAEHDYMLDILPPLWMHGEMFALGEFLTDSITSVFYTLRIDAHPMAGSTAGELRGQLVKRLAVAGVLVAILLGEQRLQDRGGLLARRIRAVRVREESLHVGGREPLGDAGRAHEEARRARRVRVLHEGLEVGRVRRRVELNVGETITSIESPRILPMMTVDEPTITMQFIANNGPFAGSEGKYVTTRNIRERLWKEIKSNVALRVEETESADTFKVSGRGELHLSVLIETMRREGFEMCVSQPQVIYREGPDGSKLEPYEDLMVDVDDPYVGVVIEKLGRRAGRMKDMGPAGQGRTRVEFTIPSRGLIGYRSEFLTDTRGTGIINHSFRDYAPYAGPLKGRQNGVLIVQDLGETNTYALYSLQERGILFMGTGERVYPGMIVGQHARDNDLIVNPNKTKKLTNIRTTAADEKLFLTPPRIMSLEAALEFINDDELVEVTPKSIRLRKRYLKEHERKRASRE